MMIDHKRFQDELIRRRVAVWDVQHQHWMQIPVALTPTSISLVDWTKLRDDGRLILGAFKKLLTWLQRSDHIILKNALFSGISDFERLFAEMPASSHWGHATIRMDLYWDGPDIKIIEVNCTIPAMQAYSDQVAEAWLAAGGQGHQITHRNMDELLASLLWHYRHQGGQSSRPRILILHRPDDSQMGELYSLVERWAKLGTAASLATPDQIRKHGLIWELKGEPFDLIYRHIFAWRLADSSIGEVLLHDSPSHIYNPVSAHYELKAFLGLLSHVSGSPELRSQLGLTFSESAAIESRVPWSRILGGDHYGVNVDEVERDLVNLVIKRSVGYGGHHVILGDQWYSAEVQAWIRSQIKFQDNRNSSAISLSQFVQWIKTSDQSLWMVQRRMSGARRRTEVLTPRGVEEWDAWFDASIFLNTGDAQICMGGVSRIAQSPIVNIGTGGGLAPFFITGSLNDSE